PVPILGKLYLDGANISTEAIPGVITLLRDRVNPAASVIHVYSVSHLPFSQPAMAPAERGDRPYLNLLDVANRAKQLQRFRDAALERRLTELFTRAIPPGRAVFPVGDKGYLRVWVAPVEPDAPLELNDRLARCCSPEDARQLISEAVADGCRASLEVMLRGSLPADAGVASIPCRQAVEGHRARANPSVALPLLVDLDRKTPAGLGAAPGLPGVCSHCALSRNGPNGGSSHRAELAVREWKQVGPVWPHELEQSPPPLAAPVPTASGRWAISPDPDPHFVRAKPAYEERTSEVLSALKRTYWNGFQNVRAGDRWPSVRNGGTPGNQRPLVNLLFSGGVFRGVYQLGTLSALSEAGLEPDVIAGASVGSITGAMVAQALAFPPGPERDGRVARLAATYLAMDRLVLTDRFADFIRGLTLRAAATRFSLHQADGFLRRYDQADSDAFNREARMVMAGLERLFYLSPFELKELVKAFRLRQSNQVYEMLRAHTQEWLDRMGVGNQILGAEPLALLITEHVLQPLQGERFTVAESVQFDRYLSEAGIYFLATATNLTEGRLEILGEQQLQGQDTATLLEGLLASSAFPGVFRPRWSWEVMPGSTRQDQYIDGGVMDNLPLDAVAHFLRVASEPELGIVARRPRYQGHDVPHLLFSASLEIIPVEPTERELNRYLTEWPVVWRRARQLRYNKKLELYALAQRALRDIWNAGTDGGGGWKPVDLEVVMVRPRWLPGTFGFHPMLGFRRQRQAESIAHGCATALLELARTARRHPEWAAGWGLDPDRLPGDPPATDRDPIVPGEAQRGHCWFRPGAVCPFSEERLGATGLPKRTIEELSKIYAACGRPETHQPR
ncbi:MAG TPA: patatin-like phospholipase family protein, partial [Gemmatimonadales bacterium]